MIIQNELVEDWITCRYSKCTYKEYDTGYEEYGCSLGGHNPKDFPCVYESCPLCCKYEVEVSDE